MVSNRILNTTSTKYNFGKTCRTCLKTIDNQIDLSILEFDDNTGIEISIIYELKILKLKIAPNDGLPQQICKDCTDRVKDIFSFRKDCERSQEILEEYFNTSTAFIDVKLKVKPFEASELAEQQNHSQITKKRTHNETGFEFIDLNIKNEILFDKYKNNDNDNNIDDKDEYNNYELLIMNNTNANNNNNTTETMKMTSNRRKPSKSDDKNDSNTCNEQNLNFNNTSQHDGNLIEDCKLISANTKLRRQKKKKPNVKKKIPRCKYCKELFKTMNEMEEHLTAYHPIDRPHICAICKKGFTKTSNRDAHMDTHVTHYAFKCDECVRCFKSERTLRIHKQQKHLIGEYRCTYCPSHFIVKGQYKLHLQKMHTLSSSNRTTTTKILICKICGKKFNSCNLLADHERWHLGESSYLCNVCGKDFTIYSTFTNHLQIHKNERKHKCSICNKGFNLRSTLKTHIATHTGLQPFKCDICHIKFTRKPSVNQHMKRKHGGLT